ncbi:MAG: maleylacetoacetate isomerase [Rhodospirillaceae bacterium]|nr:maleylacetoacetate isomerase [Rhodospirillaceae bacterium]HAA91766.1 maleylacetoacetate isomerase [Rhodospirillaceae bacterium]
MKLYNYWRSQSSYRVRIALNLKGLDWEYAPVDLGHGEQHSSEYRKIHPNSQAPVLEDSGHRIFQTMAIVEYLEEAYPVPPLYPADPAERARVRGFILTCTCEAQQRTGRRIRDYVEERFGLEILKEWYDYWTPRSLEMLENLVSDHPMTGEFVHGDTPGAADCFLVPYFYQGSYRTADFSATPTLKRIVDNCLAHPAFEKAHPDNQPDVGPDSRF